MFYTSECVRNHWCTAKAFDVFRIHGKPVPGIHEFMQTRYYPHFTAIRKAGSGGHRHNKLAGLKFGSKVDNLINQYVQSGYSTAARTKMMANRAARQLVLKTVGDCMLKILGAQVLVCDPEWGVATRIDVLAQTQTEDQRLVVVEYKTTKQKGRDARRTYYVADRAFPMLRGSLASEINSEYIHHQLQVIFSILMMERNYGLRRPVDGVVLLVCSDGEVIISKIAPRLLDLCRRLVAPHQDKLPAMRPAGPSVLPVLLKYIRPVDHHDHVLFMQALADPTFVVMDGPCTALAQQTLMYLQKKHPGAQIKINALLGRLPVRQRIEGDSFGLSADILVQDQKEALTLYGVCVLLERTVVPLTTLMGTKDARMPKLETGKPNTPLQRALLALAARAALLPGAEAKLLLVSPTEFKLKALPDDVRAVFVQ